MPDYVAITNENATFTIKFDLFLLSSSTTFLCLPLSSSVIHCMLVAISTHLYSAVYFSRGATDNNHALAIIISF